MREYTILYTYQTLKSRWNANPQTHILSHSFKLINFKHVTSNLEVYHLIQYVFVICLFSLYNEILVKWFIKFSQL